MSNILFDLFQRLNMRLKFSGLGVIIDKETDFIMVDYLDQQEVSSINDSS